MATHRQQRTTNVRGSQPNRLLANVPPLAWTVVPREAQTVTIELSSPDAHLIVDGVLQLRETTLDVMSHATALVDGVIVCYFSATLPADASFELAANDPAVRNAVGARLAPGTVTWSPVLPQPVLIADGVAQPLGVSMPLTDAGMTVDVGTVTTPVWFTYVVPPLNVNTVNFNTGGTTIGTVAPGEVKVFTWTGTSWVVT
jgi:hypothetical protein